MRTRGEECIPPARQPPVPSANPWLSPPNVYVYMTPTDPRCVSPLLACRLITLDKNPGVGPIGIGETPRRIIAKTLLVVTRSDVLETVGSTQLCAGQIAAAESAVQAVRECFQLEGTKAVLLVNASNAFNSLNRNVALRTIQFECPAISTFLINTYRQPSELFIDGEVIYSQEGTTQGDWQCPCLPWPPSP